MRTNGVTAPSGDNGSPRRYIVVQTEPAELEKENAFLRFVHHFFSPDPDEPQIIRVLRVLHGARPLIPPPDDADDAYPV